MVERQSFVVLGGEQYAKPIREALPRIHISHVAPRDLWTTDSYKTIGILFTGGTDVDPELYGEEPHPMTGMPDVERDAMEVAIWEWAKANNIPCFGICRGSQFLYVMNGGKLRQHIEGHGIMGTHRVWQPGHLFREDRTLEITSTHHQCAAFPTPKGVRVTLEGLAKGGLIIEGWENRETRDFGIQGHPEYMDRTSDAYQMFINLVRENVNI